MSSWTFVTYTDVIVNRRYVHGCHREPSLRTRTSSWTFVTYTDVIMNRCYVHGCHHEPSLRTRMSWTIVTYTNVIVNRRYVLRCHRELTGSWLMLFPSTLNSSICTQLLSDLGTLDSLLYLQNKTVNNSSNLLAPRCLFIYSLRQVYWMLYCIISTVL